MIFYILKHAIVKGTFPQIYKMSPSYDYDALNSCHSLKNGKFPIIEPNLDYFILSNKTQLTDLLSESTCSGGGLLVSERFKEIISTFNIVKHKFYPAKVMFKKEIFQNYFWMHFVSDLTDYINYSESKFVINKNYTNKGEYIEIFSKEDFFEKRNDLRQKNDAMYSIWSESLKLSSNFNFNLDFFKISTFDSNYYISETLYQELNVAKISGISYLKAFNLILPNT